MLPTGMALPEDIEELQEACINTKEEYIVVPCRLHYISPDAFNFCPNLSTIYVPDGLGNHTRNLLKKSVDHLEIEVKEYIPKSK